MRGVSWTLRRGLNSWSRTSRTVEATGLESHGFAVLVQETYLGHKFPERLERGKRWMIWHDPIRWKHPCKFLSEAETIRPWEARDGILDGGFPLQEVEDVTYCRFPIPEFPLPHGDGASMTKKTLQTLTEPECDAFSDLLDGVEETVLDEDAFDTKFKTWTWSYHSPWSRIGPTRGEYWPTPFRRAELHLFQLCGGLELSREFPNVSTVKDLWSWSSISMKATQYCRAAPLALVHLVVPDIPIVYKL